MVIESGLLFIWQIVLNSNRYDNIVNDMVEDTLIYYVGWFGLHFSMCAWVGWLYTAPAVILHI